MGTIIESVALARPGVRPFARDALWLADKAARSCLSQAGRHPGELDLLVNAGIYRGKHLEEPALAALIQEDIGANPGHPPTVGHGTFSFDVANGAAGVLTGVYLLDGLLRSGAIRLGMVVASDSDPGPRSSRGFHFPPTGGALLLASDERRLGFTDFHFENFPQFEHDFESRVEWQQLGRRKAPRRAGQNVLTIKASEDYGANCLDCAHTAAERFLAKAGLSPAQVDVLVATSDSPSFPSSLAARIGISTSRVAEPAAALRGAHTAGPVLAVEGARRAGQLDDAQTVLFVACAAGITVALAIYRT